MAQGDSETSIVNQALSALGEDPIKSLTEANKRAIQASIFYHPVRRAILRSHPWNCAKKLASLAADATAPLFDYSARYPLPVDFIRFYREDRENDMEVWDIIGPWIYVNNSSTTSGGALQCIYIYDLQDPTQMDAGFIQAFVYMLAGKLALPLTQNSTRAQQGLQMMESEMSMARLTGAQENAPREWDEDILLRSRR